MDSKPWDWSMVTDKDTWLTPCEESYYYAEKWKRENKRSVLDLGCGLGRHSILFAKYGFKVTALDISSEAVDYLRKWQKEEDVDILCKTADMSNPLPFADDAFDCIFSMHAAGHTDTAGIKKLIGEIQRVLKPGGTVFMTVCSKEAWAFSYADFPRVDENTVLKTEGPEKGVPHFFADMDDIESLFSDFDLIKVRHIDDCYCSGKRRSRKHYFIEASIDKKPAIPDYSDILGSEVKGVIDRPLGSRHPRHPDLIYPVNYGYVSGVLGGDGAEQDVYFLGEDKPIKTFCGKVIAVYHRFNDNEDKWIAAGNDKNFSDKEILESIEFQERFFDGRLYR